MIEKTLNAFSTMIFLKTKKKNHLNLIIRTCEKNSLVFTKKCIG
jgi:hypothetical protein